MDCNVQSIDQAKNFYQGRLIYLKQKVDWLLQEESFAKIANIEIKCESTEAHMDQKGEIEWYVRLYVGVPLPEGKLDFFASWVENKLQELFGIDCAVCAFIVFKEEWGDET